MKSCVAPDGSDTSVVKNFALGTAYSRSDLCILGYYYEGSVGTKKLWLVLPGRTDPLPGKRLIIAARTGLSHNTMTVTLTSDINFLLADQTGSRNTAALIQTAFQDTGNTGYVLANAEWVADPPIIGGDTTYRLEPHVIRAEDAVTPTNHAGHPFISGWSHYYGTGLETAGPRSYCLTEMANESLTCGRCGNPAA